MAKTQNLLRDWWGRRVHLRQRAAEWATHIFREHNKEADAWAEESAEGQVDEWVDTARVVRSEVIDLCGPARKYWADSPSTRNAGRFWVKTPWMLNWRNVVC